LQSVLKVAKEVTCGQTDGVDRKSCETLFRTIVWCYHHEFQCHVCRLPLNACGGKTPFLGCVT